MTSIRRKWSVALALVLLLAAGLAWMPTMSRDSELPLDPGRRGSGTDDARRTSDPDPPESPTLGGRPQEAIERVPADAPAPWASGVIVDEHNAPVEGARVLARTWRLVSGKRLEGFLSLGAPVLARSGSDGRFEIEHAPEKLVALAFVADGLTITERAGLSTEPGSRHELAIKLTVGRRLIGTVRDTEGRPIFGARISLTGAPRDDPTSPSQSVFTDREGNYEFSSLPTPLDRGLVAALGYEPSTGFEDASGWGERHDIILRRAAILVDVVDAESGEPIPAARGTLWRAAEPANRWGCLEPWKHRTDADFPEIPGRLELWMTSVDRHIGDGAAEVEVVIIAEGYKTARSGFTIGKETEPPHLRIPLTRGEADAALAGQVTDGEGASILVLLAAPVEYFLVADGELPVLRRLTAGPDGRFVIRGLPADRYRLRAEKHGRPPVTLDVVAPALDLLLEFSATGMLDVQVTAADGSLQAGVDVAVEPVDGRAILSTRTGDDGVARFDALPVGPVDVAPGMAPPTLGVVKGHPSSVRVVIEEGISSRASLVVPSRERQAIRVVDERGARVEGLTLRIRGSGVGGPASEWDRVARLAPVTDMDGRCVVDLYPGSYDGVLTLPSGARVEQPIEVAARARSEVVLRVTLGGAILRGRVLEEGTGSPIGDRPVFVSEPGGSSGWIGSAVTDAEGRYEILGLPAGPVTVHLALGSTGERGWYDPESPWPSARAEIDLATPPTEFIARIPRINGPGAIERSVSLVLRARAATGGAAIEAASGHAEVLRNGLWITAGSVQTGSAGVGDAQVVPGSDYRVYVTGPRPSPARQWKNLQIEVSASGGRVEVEVAIEEDDA